MTDKQIIDGVDVSGCVCLIQDYQRANNIIGRYEHIKNVCELGERGAEYYNLFCKDNPNCYYKQLKRKEQECEELKRQLTILDDEDVVVEITVKQFEEYKKLKQTLTEIKEIVEKSYRTPLAEKDCIKCDEFLEQILQKISEAECEN